VLSSYQWDLRSHGWAMQSNQAHAISLSKGYRKALERDAPVPVAQPQQIALDRDIIERAAQALFEFVFSSCWRFGEKHHWMNCDEKTKEGFRGEATVVIEAVWPRLLRDASRIQGAIEKDAR
jgi:hypothetical protein